MWWRRILAAILWLIALLIFAYVLLPWRPWLAQQIVARIEQQGITPASLEVEDIGLHGVRLRNVSLGKPPLTLSRAVVAYNLRALLAGAGADAATLEGLKISAQQTDLGWQIDGLPMVLGGAAKTDAPAHIPVMRAALPTLPLATLSLANSHVQVQAHGWSIDAPITLMLQQKPAAKITLKCSKPTLKLAAKIVPLDTFEITLTLDESAQQWKGTWKLSGLDYPLAGFEIMPIAGEGELTLTRDTVHVGGLISGANDARATLALDYSLAKPETSSLLIKDTSLPYMKGSMRIPSAQLMLQSPMTLKAEAVLEGLTPSPVKPQEKLNGKLMLDVKQTAKGWGGDWHAKEMAYSTEALPLPNLSGKGLLALDDAAFTASGALASDDKTHRAAFDMKYSLKTGAPSALRVSDASMPWGGGNVAVRKAVVPLGGNANITLNIDVRKVAIDTLLQSLTGNKATATGVVSGSFPLTITAAGDIHVGKGTLKADQAGIIALSPEVIPGDNAQVALARDVLKNLHYTLLSLELGMEEGGGLNVRLAVDGSNPDVENGRPIKLKVNLSGDVLDLIQQNVKLMSNPETFIKQNNHEKN